MSVGNSPIIQACDRLQAHLRSSGAPTASMGRAFREVGGASVPALLVFITPAESDAVGRMEDFEGFPVIWAVSYPKPRPLAA